jgi:hypothetical protein
MIWSLSKILPHREEVQYIQWISSLKCPINIWNLATKFAVDWITCLVFWISQTQISVPRPAEFKASSSCRSLHILSYSLLLNPITRGHISLTTDRVGIQSARSKYMLWRIDPLLRGDYVNNSRCYGAPAAYACAVTSHIEAVMQAVCSVCPLRRYINSTDRFLLSDSKWVTLGFQLWGIRQRKT